MVNECKELGDFFGHKLLETDFSCGLHTTLTSYEPHQQITKHYHANAYISLLIRGQYLEQTAKGATPLGAYDLIYRPAGYTHQNHFGERGGVCLNIEISDMPTSVATGLSHKVGLIKSEAVQVNSLLRKLSRCQPDAFESLLHLLSYFDTTQPNRVTKDKVCQGIKILQQELDIHHSVSSLAKRLGVHPVYLSRIFKQQTGSTVSEYQLGIKLQYAFRDVIDSTYSISSITHRYGFYDDSHFIRSFQSVFHFSPYQLRLRLHS